MDNVVDRMPEEFRDLFVEILAERNPGLLKEMRSQERPTLEQRMSVNDIFATEIVDSMDDEYVPTERGKKAERTIEEFWYQWPSDSP